MGDKDTVWVATYEHRHGSDVRVFRAEAQALAWRTAIALDWWDSEFPDEAAPNEDEIGDEYFDRMSECQVGECFHIQHAKIEED